jgi:hypothetical protein
MDDFTAEVVRKRIVDKQLKNILERQKQQKKNK